VSEPTLSGHQSAELSRQDGDQNGVDHPPVRTFKPRRRPLSTARAELFARLAPRFTLEEQGPPLDIADVFGSHGVVVLDIGIGVGDAMLTMARAQPELHVIGVDVHTPGIAHVLAGIEEHGLTNVRLVHGDALQFVSRMPLRSLTGIRIFFPDPWPKARHHHRRLVSDNVVARLVGLLRPDGWLHLATDNDDYAEQMRLVCDAHPRLTGGPIERPPERPLTRYEQKGIEAGHTVVDFWYNRVP
jgi:tRNA (guanine-N7-)-methyltransferase